MKVELSWDFNDDELAAMANHLGEAKVDADGVRAFLQVAVNEALDRALVEREALINDPSTNTGP